MVVKKESKGSEKGGRWGGFKVFGLREFILQSEAGSCR